MITQRVINGIVESCVSAMSWGDHIHVAVCGLELRDAEDAGLIDSSWRERAPFDEAAAKARDRPEKLTESWNQDFDQLKQILDVGGGMLEEEMMLILGLWDGLTLVPRLMSEDPSDRLKEIEPSFIEVLELNKDVIAQSRADLVYNVSHALPGHWWWRYDLEGAPSQSPKRA